MNPGRFWVQPGFIVYLYQFGGSLSESNNFCSCGAAKGDRIRGRGREEEVTKQEIKWALDVPAAGDDDR